MSKRNIFDLDDLSDIPLSLIPELKLSGDTDNKVLHLFSLAGGTINLTQLLVGYFRLYGKQEPRPHMNSICYRLIRKGLIEPAIEKGQYSLTALGRKVVKATEGVKHGD